MCRAIRIWWHKPAKKEEVKAQVRNLVKRIGNLAARLHQIKRRRRWR
jgi:hypothetical protein